MRIFSVALVMAGFLAAAPARAEDAALHFAQAGAALQYADAEVRILYGALIAKEYDPTLVKNTLDELRRTLTEAKRRVDRTETLLEDDKIKPEVLKLREAVKQCEDALDKLATDIEAQGGGEKAEDEPELGKKTEASEEEAKTHDWELLKRGAGWLGADLAVAKDHHGKLAKKIKGANLAYPPKPKGNR